VILLAVCSALLALAIVWQSIIGHIARIGYAPLRCFLLVLWFPWHITGHMLRELRPVRWGGHPNKARLLTLDYYAMPGLVFLAAWDGWFVP